MLTAPACEATQRMQWIFCPPDAVNAAGDSYPVDSGGEIPPVFTRGGGLKKPTGPTGPTGPAVPAPMDSGEGDTSVFYAGWGLKKPTGPTGPRGARPRPLPVHDLAPEVPRLPCYGYPGPEGVRPPCPPCPGPQAATLRPGGSPGLSR